MLDGGPMLPKQVFIGDERVRTAFGHFTQVVATAENHSARIQRPRWNSLNHVKLPRHQ